MNWQKVIKIVNSEYIKLLPILAFAFFMAFIPHISYPYAVHIDEWIHIAYSNALLRAGGISYIHPIFGEGLETVVTQLEIGYHLPLAIFYQISGISWMAISRYLPGIIFVFTVLSVYIFAKRMGFGWEAAFFTCLIPTTVGILGPAFLVPVALALTFIPLLLFLAFTVKTPWSYVVLCISISFLVILHAPSAVLMFILLVPFVLLGLKEDLKHSIWVMVAMAAPFIITLPWTFGMIVFETEQLFIPKPLSPYQAYLSIIPGYGYLPVLSCLIGTFALAMTGTRKNYSLLISLLVILGMLVVFFTLHYGVHILYLRGVLFAMLIMSIVAGAGLVSLRKLDLPWIDNLRLRKPRIIQATGIVLCLVFIGVTLAVAIPHRQAVFYYHMIDENDYEAFVWIRENIGSDHSKAILDPWKAAAFNAITEKYVYTWIKAAPMSKDKEAYAFIRGGSANTTFLAENGISIIYTRVSDGRQNTGFSPDNPDLIELRENVYLLEAAGAR